MTAPATIGRRGALTETLDEFLDRVDAHKPLPPDVWARVKAIFEAPLPPAAPSAPSEEGAVN